MQKKAMLIICIFVISASFMLSIANADFLAFGGKGKGTASEQATTKAGFPQKAVKCIIPYAPGAGSDIFARTLNKILEKKLGQSIVSENKPGGSTAVGISYVLTQPADGYTIFTATSTLSLLIAAGQAPFSAEDLNGLFRANADPCILVVNKKNHIKNIMEFTEHAKKNPGKIKIGGLGSGSSHHLASNTFSEKAGIRLTWIPYEGGKDAVVALMGNHIDACMITSSNVISQLQSGEFRGLAITMEQRSKFFPGIPTFKESGYDFEFMLWRGFFTKKGVPADRIAILESAFKQAYEDPEWKQYMDRFQQEYYYAGAKEFSDFFQKEVINAKEFLKKAGLTGK